MWGGTVQQIVLSPPSLYDPELCGVFPVLPIVHLCFLQVLQFPSTFKKHAGRSTGYAKFPVGVNGIPSGVDSASHPVFPVYALDPPQL